MECDNPGWSENPEIGSCVRVGEDNDGYAEAGFGSGTEAGAYRYLTKEFAITSEERMELKVTGTTKDDSSISADMLVSVEGSSGPDPARGPNPNPDLELDTVGSTERRSGGNSRGGSSVRDTYGESGNSFNPSVQITDEAAPLTEELSDDLRQINDNPGTGSNGMTALADAFCTMALMAAVAAGTPKQER